MWEIIVLTLSKIYYYLQTCMWYALLTQSGFSKLVIDILAKMTEKPVIVSSEMRKYVHVDKAMLMQIT